MLDCTVQWQHSRLQWETLNHLESGWVDLYRLHLFPELIIL